MIVDSLMLKTKEEPNLVCSVVLKWSEVLFSVALLCGLIGLKESEDVSARVCVGGVVGCV